MKKTKVIGNIVAVTVGVVGIAITLYISQNLNDSKQSLDQEKEYQEEIETDNKITKEEEQNQEVVDDQKELENSLQANQNSNYYSTTKDYQQQDSQKNPILTDQTGEVIKPITPETPIQPERPIEEIKDLVITGNMAKDGVITIANKNYKKITINSDIKENTKIVFNSLNISESLILEKPGKYQLDIINTTMPKMEVAEKHIQTLLRRSRSTEKINKTIEGATINIQDNSRVESISVNSNIEINGSNKVSNIEINNTQEIVLNVPSQNLLLNTEGIVNINKNTDNLQNIGNNTEININAAVSTLTNTKNSVIRISEGSTITNFKNQGENTTVAGKGNIINAEITANNTRIYTPVANIQADANIDYLIRQEPQINIVKAESLTQGSVNFTLNEAVNLTLKDISVICSAGKNISLFNLYTNDGINYTLTTSYYKNSSYDLYITLPNGNIISKNFSTDYANPTVTNVTTERISGNEAILKLYGVDEGGHIYYLLEESTTRKTINSSSIKENGKTAMLKVGFNSVSIKDLDPEKSYNLYYVIEGFFDNTSSVKGPINIPNQVKEPTQSEYRIDYAKEEISNRFVFKLNKAPEKELTLADFDIKCPSDSSLTIRNATFYVSPDLLTYIIVIPNNYGHKDNEYIVKIQVSETEVIEKAFITHMNPPVITGAVDGVIRTSEQTAQFTFNSDEPGEVYYGIYEWNGGIYDYNSSTPFAADVITGKIASSKQKLNAGMNTINLDLSNIKTTRYTRVWALFIDEVGNYRVGFVDHYKIPEYQGPIEPKPDSTLEIINFNITNNNYIEVEFSEEVYYNISPSDISLSVVGAGSLPNKLLFITDNSNPKKVSIKIQNYTLTKGIYELAITATDKKMQEVTLIKRIEIN